MVQMYDVIIAGGGPVGLFLACELALAQTSVLVLEQAEQPQSPWKTEPLGMRGLNTLAVEGFYRRGLLDKLFGPEHRPSIQKKPGFQFAGHFAGIMLDANKLDLSRWKYRLHGPALLSGPSTIEKIEAALTERAEGLGVTILREDPVTKVGTEDSDGVVVKTAEGSCHRGKWLVGCDGAKSVVRRAAAFDFTGTEATFTAYAIHCDLEKPEKLNRGFNVTDTGMYITGIPGSLYLVDFDNGAFNRKQEITKDHLQEVTNRIAGNEDVKISKVYLASAFSDASKLATRYRKGRILLAGDVAHIHPPFGTPGLNLGLGDAMNLGWKLAATIRQESTTAGNGLDLTLLNSYEHERYPVGDQVLDYTRAQVEAIQPNPHGKAIRALIEDTIKTVDGTNLFIDRFWGLSQRYRLADNQVSADALVGSSAPDFDFVDGSRLGPKLMVGRGLLVDFGSDGMMKGLILGWKFTTGIEYIEMKAVDQCDLRALIVRPDGIVAWAVDANVEPEVDAANTALAKWFGC